MKKRPQLKKMSLAIALCIGTAPVAFAQTADKTDKEAKKDAPQRVVITGSNIKRIDTETVSPVTTITKEQIARSGVTSVVDLLRNVSSAGGNMGEFNGTNSFRNGATSINLRGLPTLVLLNGYRLPTSGSDSGEGYTAVDLNMIPLAAIERVEILKDGASAIYGTDAVGGVVNFITKQENSGITVDASYGRTGYNDGGVAKASIGGGIGNRAEDKYNLTFAFAAENSKAINMADRPWANRYDFRKDGGLFQGNVYGANGDDPGTLSFTSADRFPDPACAKERQLAYFNAPEWFASSKKTGCFYTPAEGNQFRPEIHRYSLASVFNYDINDQTSVFVQAFANRLELKQIAPPNALLDADGNPFGIEASNPFNPYGKFVRVRRLFPAQEGGNDVSVNTFWLVGGIKAQLANWEFSASAGHGEERGNVKTKGAFLRDKMADYIANGKFNPFGQRTNSQDVINQLTADMGVKTKTTTDFVKLSATTEFGKLPGGPIGFAAGTEFKRESLKYDPTQQWREGAIGGYTYNGTIDGSENLKAVYSELNLPVLKSLEIQAAARYDQYQYAGNTLNPKIGIRWSPVETLMVRANYSTGFRAPTLSQQFNSGRGAYYRAKDFKRCNEDSDIFYLDCSRSVLGLASGTQSIKPEKSEQYNFGFVFEPTQNLSLGMTYWGIRWTDRIEMTDMATVITGEDSTYKGFVTRLPVTQDDIDAYNALTPQERAAMGPLVGRIKSVRLGYVNRSKVSTTGIDADIAYTMKTGLGKFRPYADATYTIKYDSTLSPDDPYVNCHGNMACDSGEMSSPTFMANVGLGWEKDAWAANTVMHYTHHYHVSRSPTATINSYGYDMYKKGVMVPATYIFDASLTYKGYKNTTLRFGINNLFNRDPSFNPGSAIGYDSAFGDPRGRYIYGSVSYRFN